jgi:hypothetical protein
MPVPTDGDKKATPKRINGRCPKGYSFNRNKCVFNPDSTYWREQSVRDVLTNSFKIEPDVGIKEVLAKWRWDDKSKSSASSYTGAAVAAVGILGTIFVGNLLIGAISFAVTWAVPASIATLGLVTLGTLYVFSRKYYEHKQKKKLDIDQWQLFAYEINNIVGAGNDQIGLLRNLKGEIEDWSKTQEAGITGETIKDLIKKINVVINCEKNEDCSDKLGEIVQFLIVKIQVGLENQDVPDVENIPKGCKMPEYIVTLNEEERTINVNDVSYDGRENFSVPTVRIKLPEGTRELEERVMKVMKAAAAEIQSCVVNEITAIHDAQRRFLDEVIHKYSLWSGRYLSDDKFADIEDNLKDVETVDDFNLFSKFMCQFSEHKSDIKKEERYAKADKRLKLDIKQIIAIRKLQVKTILDLYGSYIYNIDNLTKLDYWNKTLSLFEDQGVGYKGLFKKAITFTGHIDIDYRSNSIKKLKDRLDAAIQNEKQQSSVGKSSYFYYGPGPPVSSQPKLKF